MEYKFLYEVSFVLFADADISELVEGLPNVDVNDSYLDDDGDWNIECTTYFTVMKNKNNNKPDLDLITSMMGSRLQYVPACWDYHYIKGVDNDFWWQP